ncbi:hypothetical protein [Frankia nepalensis]|uniref:Uncharacterized protein n=1 Tax=Frankia nepalensis TaxID=1836974 RepID=A0A937UT19_9ACTN|nr:hypothetical protein [Frankia nepalensis]MBL7499072.1 hypothetical protein [Frankia nepalensis]MBL7511418.1 hypothetical protein [Frankia nepalensis]MBL7629521.1 hypothetical protein [Frankia nepalensis]
MSDAGDAGAATGLDDLDRARVRGVCASLRSSSLESLLGQVFADVDAAPALVDSISRHCVLDHCALLIFPDDFDHALRVLPELGALPGPVVPSVIVKARLAERYRVPADSLDVRITHATLAGATDVPGEPRPTIEMFMLRRSPDLPAGIVARERGLELERHVALRLVEPDPIVIQGLRWVLREHAGFGWDGGGYNPHDGAEYGGTSALYFLGWTQDPAGGTPRRQRIEIKFHGHYPDITTAHVEAARDDQAVAAAAVAAAAAAAAANQPSPLALPLEPARPRGSSAPFDPAEQALRRQRLALLQAEARRRAAERRVGLTGSLAPRLRSEWGQRLRAVTRSASHQ